MNKKDIYDVSLFVVAGTASLLLSLYKPKGLTGFFVYVFTLLALVIIFRLIKRRITK